MHRLFRFTAISTLAVLASLSFPLTSSAQAFAYVTNRSGNSVPVIDTSRNTAVATIPVEKAPVSVAITANGRHAYVTKGCRHPDR